MKQEYVGCTDRAGNALLSPLYWSAGSFANGCFSVFSSFVPGRSDEVRTGQHRMCFYCLIRFLCRKWQERSPEIQTNTETVQGKCAKRNTAECGIAETIRGFSVPFGAQPPRLLTVNEKERLTKRGNTGKAGPKAGREAGSR